MDLFKKSATPYHLENIPAAQQKAGLRKFMKPTADEIDSLTPGDMVRLFFVFDFKPDDGCRAERMWVEISEKNGAHFKGYLTNQPVYLKNLSAGDLLSFSGDNIATILCPPMFDEKKTAFISKKALEAKEVNWAFKDAPVNAADSGWQLFYGDESDDYNNDPSNIHLLTLEEILSFEPRLEEVFASKKEAFEWNKSEFKFVEADE